MPKLVNLGSLCIDNVYRVASIAAPGETVASASHEIHPGGKGLNQSIAAARGGARVVHVGCVGADGVWLRDQLEGERVDTDDIRVVDQPSGHAVIQVDDAGRNAIVIAGGANRVLGAEDVNAALARLQAGDWLLLQNEINDLPRVLAQARQSHAQVAFNVAPADGREASYDLSAVKLLIVNEIEAAALAEVADAHEAVRALRVRCPAADVVLTLGADGLVYAEAASDDLTTLPALPVDAVDETAAGDAFIGFLMAGLLAGQPLADALRLASAAGALAVTQPGAASSIPTLAQVKELLTG